MILSDIWHIYILGKHKHQYKRTDDAHYEIHTYGNVVRTITYQRHQCLICRNIVGLDDWQIKDLPTDMKYG